MTILQVKVIFCVNEGGVECACQCTRLHRPSTWCCGVGSDFILVRPGMHKPNCYVQQRPCQIGACKAGNSRIVFWAPKPFLGQQICSRSRLQQAIDFANASEGSCINSLFSSTSRFDFSPSLFKTVW